METKTKHMFGKILGELYRLQAAFDVPCSATPARIYGLLNGFETEIDAELRETGVVEAEKVRAVMDVLQPIWDDTDKLKQFEGYYKIDGDLKNRGIDRGEAIKVLTFLKANGQFLEVIEKMDTPNSPAECRTFELSKWDS